MLVLENSFKVERNFSCVLYSHAHMCACVLLDGSVGWVGTGGGFVFTPTHGQHSFPQPFYLDALYEAHTVSQNEMCMKIKNDKSWQIKITHAHPYAAVLCCQFTCIQNGERPSSPAHFGTLRVYPSSWHQNSILTPPSFLHLESAPFANPRTSMSGIVIFLASFPLPFSLRFSFTFRFPLPLAFFHFWRFYWEMALWHQRCKILF